MDEQQQKIDPIRDRYFGPLETAEKASDFLFYACAVVSLAAFFVDKAKYPGAYNVVQSGLVLGVMALWAIGLAIRLYFAPRAQDRRFSDFLSSAFDIGLTHERTSGYYDKTSSATNPIAIQLLENSFHSKDIALRMLSIERWKVAIYGLLLAIAILIRTTDLGFLAILAQAIFSEQLLSRWARLEWFRIKSERVYDELFRLFQAKPDAKKFEVLVLELLGQYESAKANSGITLSGTIFAKRRDALMREWEEVKRTLGLVQAVGRNRGRIRGAEGSEGE